MIAGKRASPCSLRSFDGAVDVNEKGTQADNAVSARLIAVDAN